MKKLLVALGVALLLAGCGDPEDIRGGEYPLLIACEACPKQVSKEADECPECGHPTPRGIESRKWADWKATPEPHGGLEVLAEIRKAKKSNATQLTLSKNQITDVSPLAGLTNLTHLSLDDNQITDGTPLKGLNKLKILYLYDNPTLADQKAMLRKALPNCEIEF